MRHGVSDELISRHWPDDLSDESVSFQIPSQANSSNLLDDVEGEFFGTTHQTIDTPLPHKKFGLSDLVPSTQRQTSSVVSDPSLERSPPKLSLPIPSDVSVASGSEASRNVTRTLPPQKPVLSQPCAPSVITPNAEGTELIPLDGKSTRIPQDLRKDLNADVEPSTSSRLGPITRKKEVSKGVPSTSIDAMEKRPAKPMSYDELKKSVNFPERQDPALVLPGVKTKRTVIDGGIIKRSKLAVSKSSNVRTVSVSRLPVPEPPLIMISQSDKADKGNISDATDSRLEANITSGGEGVAQQLLMIGQQFLNSISSRVSTKEENAIPPSSEAQGVGASEKQTQIVEHSVPCKDDPLTLSQLSPRKPESGSRSIKESVISIPMSPMRPSKKRVSGTLENADGIAWKQSENEDIRDSTPTTNNTNDMRTLQPSRGKNGVASTSSQVLAKRLKAKAVARRQSPVTAKGKTKAVARTNLPRTKPSGARDSVRADKPKPDTGRALHASFPLPPRIGGHMATVNKTSSTLLLPKPTRPIEFQFEVDAQVEASRNREKAESLRKRLKVHHEPVMQDSRALRAAYSASLGGSRERKTPVVPDGFTFSTELRAKEREKFDEYVRTKQQEIERQLEERRKQREIEEQKEIKEMRRKAVPKANDIPEWYANVPKRKGINESV